MYPLPSAGAVDPLAHEVLRRLRGPAVATVRLLAGDDLTVDDVRGACARLYAAHLIVWYPEDDRAVFGRLAPSWLDQHP